MTQAEACATGISLHFAQVLSFPADSKAHVFGATNVAAEAATYNAYQEIKGTQRIKDCQEIEGQPEINDKWRMRL